MGSNLTVKRGDIWLVNLDPTIGAEIKKTRPAVIIQNDTGNQYAPTTIVVPITSQQVSNLYPTDALIGQLETTCKAMTSQIRAIDKKRLIKKIARVEDLSAVESSTKISLGLK